MKHFYHIYCSLFKAPSAAEQGSRLPDFPESPFRTLNPAPARERESVPAIIVQSLAEAGANVKSPPDSVSVSAISR